MDKAKLFSAFRAHLLAQRADLVRSRDDARGGARVDGSHRPENRGERAAVTAQGYLTAGIGQRLDEIDAALVAFDRLAPGPRDQVGPGALVGLLDDGERQRWLLLVPGGLGTRLDVDGTSITCLSPTSPLARALVGRHVDDEISFRATEFVVTQVR